MYEQMLAFMNNINGGVSAVTFSGDTVDYVFANDYYFEMFGYTREQFMRELPRRAFDLVYPDDRRMAFDAASAALESGEPFELEYRVVKRDGTVIWIRCNGLSCMVEGYDAPVQLAVTRDITGEKEAEAQILSANEQLRFLNDTAHDLLAQTDTDAGMNMVLLKVLNHFGADRAYVFECDEVRQVCNNTYEVCAPGVESAIDMLKDIPYAATPFWWPALFEDTYINIEDVSALGEDRAQEKRILEQQAINSLIAVPLNRDGKLIGFIGVDNPRKQQSGINHLKAIGDYTAILLTRRDLNAKIDNDNKMLKELMDDTPGGFVRMRLNSDGITVPVYVNDGFCKLVGMTRDEVFANYQSDCMWGVHPDDRDAVRATVANMLAGGDARGAKYRLKHGAGGYIWLMISGRMTRASSGEIYFNVYYTEITLTEQEKKELSFREMLPVALDAMMAVSNDLSFIKDMDMKYICCSRAFAKMVGLADAADIVGKTDYDLFDRELADKYYNEERRLVESGKSLVDHVERLPYADGTIRYRAISRYPLNSPSGNVLGLYCIGRDITEDREAYAHLELLTNSMPGGIASYVHSPDGLRITYFNDGFCNMLGYTRAEYEKISATGVTNVTFSEDVPMIMAQVNEMVSGGAPVNCIYRVHVRGGGYKWVNLRCGVAERNGDICAFTAVLYDITEQKAAADAARIHDEEMRAAMSHMGKMICEFDPVARTLTLPEFFAGRYDVPAVLRDFPTFIIERNIIDEPYIGAFIEFFESIRRGEKVGAVEYRERWADGSMHWALAEFSTFFDSGGQPVKAIVAVEDTTQQHLRYELERSRPSLNEENLIVHALFNLTTGETLDYSYRNGDEVALDDRTALTYGADNINALIINAEERARYRALNNPESLLKRFERGETELTIDYRRRMPDGDVVWVRNLMSMVRAPGGADVLLFDYFYNIEAEKTLELINRSLINESYDYVARVNGRNGRFEIIGNSGLQYGMPPQRVENLSELTRIMTEAYIHRDDRDMIIKCISVENIKNELEQKDKIQLIYRQLQTEGAVRYKKLSAYYLDREREIIIITREDVSDFVKNEMHKQELLADALAAANQANQAKTQFLSRMSHELRTPMNAIIGLSALSSSEVNDPKLMEDAIGKIGMSARYLLSLINDILEMSRIESGRMTLNEAPFDFEDFISQVNAIIYTQAEKKGVDFDAIVSSYTEPSYVGDATKLQEILVNVLGNAVKFTPSGGKVSLTIEQLRFAKQRATLRFTVTDTGIGIDEKFLPHLFDSFAQESAHYTSTSTGTGLGLAITKHLVEMMNGKITVKSIKNVGSVFTIDVQLGISKESRKYLDMIASMNLEKLRALVVDDDVTVCVSTESILKAMGIRAEWASSGGQAVERVIQNHAASQDYDAIFIDWNMPDMDGIETARRIRKIVGPDITIIIMTAYDWSTFEAEAREAGVNMFMEKPLFQTSIVKAFEKVYLHKHDKVEPARPATFDFSGKRILLAEDHPLNIEVATRLLEKAGAKVVVVNNGLEAIEAFTTEKAGWFDIILMDIRMPVMDGLTAAKSIRSLRKAGSKTIPIVAMTANAFDEDVELSLSSGMNAHLAKPIEPSVLYSTIDRLLKQ